MTESSSNTLLAPRFLFRFAVPVLRREPIWKAGGVELDESYRLLNLGGTGRRHRGPRTRVCRRADGVERRRPGVQRARRRQEAAGVVPRRPARRQRRVASVDRHAGDAQHSPREPLLPSLRVSAGRRRTRQDEPVADQLLINRARENARPIRPRELQVASRVTKTGYWLAAFVPAVALAGYDPQQHRQIGFTYAVYDRELGLQTFATGPAFPFDEDPTCWAALELAESLNARADALSACGLAVL